MKTDAEIAKAVVDALRWDSLIPWDKIRVKVENGRVTTEGEVVWQFEKDAIPDAIAYLPGVKEVMNLVMVRPKADPVTIQQKSSPVLKETPSLMPARSLSQTMKMV